MNLAVKPEWEYYLETIVKAFPLITAITFVSGYIGFHTFTAIYHLPINHTDLSTIAGIGILNLIYFSVLYIFSSRKRPPRFSTVFIVYAIFKMLLYSPVFLAVVLPVYLAGSSYEKNQKVKRLTFSQKKKERVKYLKYLLGLDVFFLLSGLVTFLFLDGNFFIISITIYSLLYLFFRYKRHKIIPNFYNLIFIVLFPVISMFYMFSYSDSNILGMNTQQATIYTVTDTLKTQIVFNDAEFFYTLSDSTNIVTAIRRDEVKKIIAKADRTKLEGFCKSIKIF